MAEHFSCCIASWIRIILPDPELQLNQESDPAYMVKDSSVVAPDSMGSLDPYPDPDSMNPDPQH
jgi:hypothetical protein